MELKTQLITRKCEIDAAHRVMHEKMKCFNIHGHRYVIELTFSFVSMEDIGYPIDFKEIKRVGCAWIDDMLDHAIILNPHDTILIETAKKLNSKYWLMSLNNHGYCNPTVENIAREIFAAMEMLFIHYPLIVIKNVRVYETPNCFTDCAYVPETEKSNFRKMNEQKILAYICAKGIVEYDERKI